MLYFVRDHHTSHLNKPINREVRESQLNPGPSSGTCKDSGIVLKLRILCGVMALWLFAHLMVYISTEYLLFIP